ncbi:MAG: biliverdin-producing heme oxygenase [Herminiimonas sp.]|nr:biliverdin-producing heme oxygenase [Herminiimonas sp.]
MMARAAKIEADTIPGDEPSAFHRRLREVVKVPHHVLDHHPLMAALLKDGVSHDDYGNALAALRGVIALTEAEILRYLGQHPGLFDYASRIKLPALDADLAELQRPPTAPPAAGRRIRNHGELFGTLYTLEGATLGGQFIARHLRKSHPDDLPLRFYLIYGDAVRDRWRAFLDAAQMHCLPAEFPAAAAAAVALFEAIGAHLDRQQADMAVRSMPR